jgi:hypothetical protein
MSTRATVWIKSGDEERFLYHHSDGYMLDEELDPILKGLTEEQWTADGVAEAIVREYEDYGKHKVDGVGWDSEYVYKISVDGKTLEKFECGIEDTERGDRKDEKTQKKYSVKVYDYNPLKAPEDGRIRQKIERFAYDMVSFMEYMGRIHGLDEEDMETAVDMTYDLLKKRKDGDNRI